MNKNNKTTDNQSTGWPCPRRSSDTQIKGSSINTEEHPRNNSTTSLTDSKISLAEKRKRSCSLASGFNNVLQSTAEPSVVSTMSPDKYLRKLSDSGGSNSSGSSSSNESNDHKSSRHYERFLSLKTDNGDVNDNTTINSKILKQKEGDATVMEDSLRNRKGKLILHPTYYSGGDASEINPTDYSGNKVCREIYQATLQRSPPPPPPPPVPIELHHTSHPVNRRRRSSWTSADNSFYYNDHKNNIESFDPDCPLRSSKGTLLQQQQPLAFPVLHKEKPINESAWLSAAAPLGHLAPSFQKCMQQWCPSFLLYIPPFSAIYIALKVLDTIVITSWTFTRFIWLWVIPITLIWICAIMTSVTLCSLLYIMVYKSFAPAKTLSFPIYFNHNPDPLFLTEPYIDFKSISTSSKNEPYFSMIGFSSFFSLENNKLLNHLKDKYYKGKMNGQNKPNISNNALFSSSISNHGASCYKTSATSLNEDEAQTQGTGRMTGSDGIKKDFVNKKNTAVGFITFDNRTWEYGTTGISEPERCFYYHQLQSQGRNEEAYNILHLRQLPRDRYHRRHGRPFHTLADSVTHKGFKLQLNHDYDLNLVMEYRYNDIQLEKSVFEELLARKNLQPDFPHHDKSDEGYHHFLKEKHDFNLHNMNNLVIFPQVVMISLELFDLTCIRKIRSSRPHIPDYKLKKKPEMDSIYNMLKTNLLNAFSFLLARTGLIKTEKTTEAAIPTIRKEVVPLVEKLHVATYLDFHLARLEMTPSLPLVSSSLVLEPRLATFQYIIKKHSWIAGTLFIIITSAISSIVLSIVLISFYAGGLHSNNNNNRLNNGCSFDAANNIGPQPFFEENSGRHSIDDIHYMSQNVEDQHNLHSLIYH